MFICEQVKDVEFEIHLLCLDYIGPLEIKISVRIHLSAIFCVLFLLIKSRTRSPSFEKKEVLL